jgi:hypothetical protein
MAQSLNRDESAGAGEGPLRHGHAESQPVSAALGTGRQPPPTAVAASPHAAKFRVAIAVLIALGLASLAFAALTVGHNRTHRSSAPWSAWAPSDSGTVGAGEIAAHIAPLYRASAASQLDVVTLVNIANPNVTAISPSSGLELAVQTSPTALALLNGGTIAYNICGIGTPTCALPGTPSAARLLLLRREALELALYTLRYISGIQNVVALLPPGRTQVSNALSPTRPTRTSMTKSIGLAVLFDRQELAPLLARPVSQTLAEFPPFVTQLPLWLRTVDAGIVDQVTAHGMFVQRIEQLQDGSHLLVLTVLPPQ